MRAAILFLLLFPLFACSSFDRRKELTSNLILDSAGNINENTFQSAFKSRFSNGSDIKDLREFVINNKGKCFEHSNHKQRCEIPIKGAYCRANLIGIDISTNESKIKDLQITFDHLTC